MIHKPLDLNNTQRCLRAAYGTMLQQRRRSARVLVDIPVYVRVSDLGKFVARISDLSISGLALHFEQELPLNHEVSLLVQLPESNSLIRVTGKIVNSNASGRAGVRFCSLPDEDLGCLQSWLAAQLANLEQAAMPAESPRTLREEGVQPNEWWTES
jgi:hypothetical protein